MVGQSKVVAIGERGLDYYRDRSKKEDQKRLFHKHMELAEKHNLPVIIHNREASSDCLEIVRKFSGRVMVLFIVLPEAGVMPGYSI